MSKIGISLLFLFIVGGCASTVAPVPENKSYASYVGDRETIRLGEVVVSVPILDIPQRYQNLHVEFSALVNPTAAYFATGSSGYYENLKSYEYPDIH